MPDNGRFAIAKAIRAGRVGVSGDSDDVAQPVERKLKAMLNHPGSGQMYGTHRASAPYEPPAPDTGELRNSITWGKERLKDGAQVTIGSTAEHSVYTEFGTRHMQPRPWFRPVMFAVRLKVHDPWLKGIVKRERGKAREMGGKG